MRYVNDDGTIDYDTIEARERAEDEAAEWALERQYEDRIIAGGQGRDEWAMMRDVRVIIGYMLVCAGAAFLIVILIALGIMI